MVDVALAGVLAELPAPLARLFVDVFLEEVLETPLKGGFLFFTLPRIVVVLLPARVLRAPFFATPFAVVLWVFVLVLQEGQVQNELLLPLEAKRLLLALAAREDLGHHAEEYFLDF